MRKILTTILFSALAVFYIVSVALAATNIVADPTTARWAWNDVISWMDFYVTNTVLVESSGIQGYASSSLGIISLDCATTPVGNICGTSNYQALNDGSGNLSGWAWNDAVGWISFCGGLSTESCPGAISYRVLVNGTTGDFTGWAWNDAAGWLSFNCTDPGLCGTSTYKVQTSWLATSTTGYLDSSTFDTGVSGGAQINSVVWQGSMPAPANGAFVSFQFAVSSDSGGPWDYKGPDGTSSTYYTPSGPNVSYPVDYSLHNNARYFRYRITLSSNIDQTSSPRVDSVSVNWSR
ncbi:MAG: hypothetical protein A2855_02800 [Candidatus Liptonbacteria bacterium RIFCSPHIGHO2_01_FULL_57_28]|uniref:Uncharacterized protein n=1 Tax=Candidatus Liptonbacteria bacterium RIFCSPHIGHO2_01_FULL_57_28 TaxID=1798647 RepID=A0A1G2CA01_9BACT|nr:MAG: hypothetical protein A2855_02800 [Candidatus Liptonbacteria bacterium RIFCSPHIGHO2_01_FULL_57_28]